jgi:hypothetical protein
MRNNSLKAPPTKSDPASLRAAIGDFASSTRAERLGPGIRNSTNRWNSQTQT